MASETFSPTPAPQQPDVPPNTPPSAAPLKPPRQSLMGRGGLLGNNFGDNLFYYGTLAFAATVLVICLMVGWRLYQTASPAIHRYGFGFIYTTKWDPNVGFDGEYSGAWPYIFGTLVSSFLALLLAVPIGLGTAIFLAELAPKWMRSPLGFMVELLAAVPSVVYGLWGRLVMVPWLQTKQTWMSDYGYNALDTFEKGLVKTTGIKAFSTYGPSHLIDGAPTGQSMMAGALILAIMVLPFITAVSREVIKAVPPTQREAAFGLGATRWEAIRSPVLRYARSGIIGAIILGLARALGETMAITMVIGNADKASSSLLAPAATLSSKLANEFGEAQGGQLDSLMYLALVLFGITIVVNGFARLLIWNMSRSMSGASRE